jgi:MYXO-CTERM domain-containing protein
MRLAGFVLSLAMVTSFAAIASADVPRAPPPAPGCRCSLIGEATDGVPVGAMVGTGALLLLVSRRRKR